MDLDPLFDVARETTCGVYKNALRQLVYGYANVSINSKGDVLQDLHDDRIEKKDLEDAALLFNLNFRSAGEMHEGVVKGHLIESFFYDPEKLSVMKLARSDGAPEAAWWVGFFVPDAEVFKKVIDGRYSMFSIQGKAQREPV